MEALSIEAPTVSLAENIPPLEVAPVIEPVSLPPFVLGVKPVLLTGKAAFAAQAENLTANVKKDKFPSFVRF